MTLLAFRLLVVMVFTVTAVTVFGAQGLQTGSFQGEELESFLQNAEVTDLEGTEEGVTLPRRRRSSWTPGHTLRFSRHRRLQTRTHEVAQRRHRGRFPRQLEDRGRGLRARQDDRPRHGPTTVERRHRRDRGSMQWWVDNAMSELARVEDGIPPPDPQAWGDMVYKMRLFDSLIYNVDRQVRNILVTEDWRIVLIDHSRSFRTTAELREPEQMIRFSKSLLEKYC